MNVATTEGANMGAHDKRVAKAAEELECMRIINLLREPQAATVTLMCQNEEGSGPNNEAVEVCDEWTGWVERRFYGRTVLEALKSALAARALETGV